jgi:hypothetical protein
MQRVDSGKNQAKRAVKLRFGRAGRHSLLSVSAGEIVAARRAGK